MGRLSLHPSVQLIMLSLAALVVAMALPLVCIQTLPAATLAASAAEGSGRRPDPTDSLKSTTICLKIRGSSCVACLKHLESALAAFAGVISVEVVADAINIHTDIENGKQHPRKFKHDAVYIVKFDSCRTSAREIESFVRQRDFRIISSRVLKPRVQQ